MLYGLLIIIFFLILICISLGITCNNKEKIIKILRENNADLRNLIQDLDKECPK